MQVTTLGWGVKQSFRNYVESVGGRIETLGAAVRATDGGFIFPAAPDGDLRLDEDGRPTGVGRFAGEVRFEAHGGMLSVLLTALAIEIGPSGAVLTVAGERGERLELATLDLAAITSGDDGDLVIPVALSMDGSYFLGDHYPPRTALDPVRLGIR
jgi:hypothetical protein